MPAEVAPFATCETNSRNQNFRHNWCRGAGQTSKRSFLGFWEGNSWRQNNNYHVIPFDVTSLTERVVDALVTESYFTVHLVCTVHDVSITIGYRIWIRTQTRSWSSSMIKRLKTLESFNWKWFFKSVFWCENSNKTYTISIFFKQFARQSRNDMTIESRIPKWSCLS